MLFHQVLVSEEVPYVDVSFKKGSLHFVTLFVEQFANIWN